MGKFAVIVDLEVRAENADAFVEAALENAKLSVRDEPGCHRFDVIRALDDKTKITFYEVFENLAAFQAHATFPHATAFMGKAKQMVVNQAGRRGEVLTEVEK